MLLKAIVNIKECGKGWCLSKVGQGRIALPEVLSVATPSGYRLYDSLYNCLRVALLMNSLINFIGSD